MERSRLLASVAFDGGRGVMVDAVSGATATLEGRYAVVDGIRGKAVRFDGLSTRVHFEHGPAVSCSFTVEAWFAVAAYPWNWAPFLDQHDRPEPVNVLGRLFRDPEIPSRGILFGINHAGQAGLFIACTVPEEELDMDEGNWTGVTSPHVPMSREHEGGRIPLREWTHVAGVHDQDARKVRLYVNGELAGEASTRGPLLPAPDLPVHVGRRREMDFPMGGERPTSHAKANIHFDGIIDGIKVHDTALPGDAIKALFDAVRRETLPAPAIPPRVLPTGPPGPGRFGAYYTRLQYYDEWDAPWRVDTHPDVLVRFNDELGTRLIFWRGTSYIPCWVTPKENSDEHIWFTNEFNETWGPDVDGCAEPMSDKMCRHSHVRIIETSDARVVIHWRYALVDVHYQFARLDYNGWGDWSDGYWTVYPDGVGVRRMSLKTRDPLWPHEFQESILVEGPGQKPEDLVHATAVTMLNMKGESKVYDWSGGCPASMDEPDRCNIQVINVKSKARPFLAVPDGPSVARAHTDDGHGDLSKPYFCPFTGGIHRENAIFPFWNHWPTSQIASDGRVAPAADRAGHSSFSNLREWEDHEITADSRTKLMLVGLLHGDDARAVDLARSWLTPPPARVTTGSTSGIADPVYDRTERAYVITVPGGIKAPVIRFAIDASPERPLVNLAMVVVNWGDHPCSVSVNDERVAGDGVLHAGRRVGLETTDLVLFLRVEARARVAISLRKEEE